MWKEYSNIKKLIKYIDEYNHGNINNIDHIIISNEINSTRYYDSFYKLYELSKHSYYNYHFSSNDYFYEVFAYKDQDIDHNSMYQVLFCNNYTQIINFKENEYDNKQIVGSFENPGKIYSFYDGAIIVLQSKEKLNFNYDYLE